MESNKNPNVYIGFDSRESVCTYVAAHSINKRTSIKPYIHYLKHRELREKGIFNRLWITGHGGSSENIDMIDGKTFSTEFSHTRFLVPHLMQYNGWALFMDADMIFLSDVKKLFELCDDRYAIMCVKHQYPQASETTKMDGRAQRFYYRKNWSSFVLWNCGHPANCDITPERVNFMHGKDLHAFSWLQDYQIGDLPYDYNYISGISPKLAPEKGNRPMVIHYSDGGPWFEECTSVPYAKYWLDEYEDWQKNGADKKGITEVPTVRYE